MRHWLLFFLLSLGIGGCVSFGWFGSRAVNLNGLGGGFFGVRPSSAAAAHGFIKVDGGTFPGDTVRDSTFLSATNLVVVTSNGNAGVSTDGGGTWTLVVSATLAAISPQILAVNNAATILMTSGGTKVARSTDGGHTWTDVTPAGGVVQFIYYSKLFDKFFFFDGTTAKAWSSPDGLVWTSKALSAVLLSEEFFNDFAESAARIIAVGRNQATTRGNMWVSTDAVNWALSFNDALNTTQDQVIWSGVSFLVLSTNPGTARALSSNGEPPFWTLNSTAVPPGPPFGAGTPGWAFFNGALYNGFNPVDGTSLAKSTDEGATWTAVPVTVAGFTSAAGLAVSTHATPLLYAFDRGIVQSADGSSWSTGLASFSGGGFINTIRSRFGFSIAVGQDDAGDGYIARETTP
jgi:hypothetical protein